MAVSLEHLRLLGSQTHFKHRYVESPRITHENEAFATRVKSTLQTYEIDLVLTGLETERRASVDWYGVFDAGKKPGEHVPLRLGERGLFIELVEGSPNYLDSGILGNMEELDVEVHWQKDVRPGPQQTFCRFVMTFFPDGAIRIFGDPSHGAVILPRNVNKLNIDSALTAALENPEEFLVTPHN